LVEKEETLEEEEESRNTQEKTTNMERAERPLIYSKVDNAADLVAASAEGTGRKTEARTGGREKD